MRCAVKNDFDCIYVVCMSILFALDQPYSTLVWTLPICLTKISGKGQVCHSTGDEESSICVVIWTNAHFRLITSVIHRIWSVQRSTTSKDKV